MLSIRASQNAKRRKKTLRALLSKPSSKSKQASKWATLGADKTSQQLHQYAANQTSRMAIIIFFAYLILAYILAYVDGMRGVDPFYFFATTVTTVGFGDLVLTQQNTRAAAIVLLPLGLIVIGFSMSFMQAKLAEHAAEHHKNYKDKLSLWWEEFDEDGSGSLSFDEFKDGVKRKVLLTNILPEFMLEDMYDAMLKFEGEPWLLADDMELAGKYADATAEDWGERVAQAFPYRTRAILELRLKNLTDPEHVAYKRLHGLPTSHKTGGGGGGGAEGAAADEVDEGDDDDDGYYDDDGDEKSFFDSIAWKYIKLLIHFAFVVGIGVLFLVSYQKEFKQQEKAAKAQDDVGDAFTLVDAIYFSVIICTTVGYGHRIVPITDGCKVWMIFYMFLGTAYVAALINEMSEIYLRDVAGENITTVVEESTLFLHQADISEDGEITESDYLLFKLRELLEVPEATMKQAQKRFKELSKRNPGWVIVGEDVPSDQQVLELKEEQRSSRSQKQHGGPSADKTLQELWEAKPAHEKALDGLESDQGGGGKGGGAAGGGLGGASEANVDHVRKLWEGEAKRLSKFVFLLVGAYLALGYWVLSKEMPAYPKVDRFYFLSATISTVGYGDLAPRAQDTRAAAIILVPMGLSILGLVLSYYRANALATPPKGSHHRTCASYIVDRARELDAIFGDGDGKLSKKELKLQLRRSFEYTAARLSCLCCSSKRIGGTRSMDFEKKIHVTSFLWHTWDIFLAEVLDEIVGPATRVGKARKRWADWVDSFTGEDSALGRRCEQFPRLCKALGLLLTLAVVSTISAAFFKGYGKENEKLALTWIDAFYMATVTCSSVGYGDITPQTQMGKFFSIWYLLASTVVVAGVLGGAIDLYVTDTVDARVQDEIINTDIFLHYCDIDGSMKISEADFILFKMHQLQLVDEELKERLMKRFEELDIFGSGGLRIGFEIPNKQQVAELKDELRRKIKRKLDEERRSPLGLAEQDFNELDSVKVLMKLWKIKQEKLADRISQKYKIPQAHKHAKLKLREMSKECVKLIEEKWEEEELERKKAPPATRRGNRKKTPARKVSIDKSPKSAKPGNGSSASAAPAGASARHFD